MEAATTAPAGKTPQPLPGARHPQPLPGVPDKWSGSPLANITYSSLGSVVAMAVHPPHTDFRAFDRSKPLFVKAGSSFADAVKAAVRRASQQNRWGATAAQGVLQSKAGSYYLTTLGGPLGRPEFTHTLDTKPTSVSRLSDDLKAVVGGSSWVNFTNEAIDT